MAVSSSVNREMTIGRLYLRAFQLAGLYEASQSLRTADENLAKDFAEAIMDELSVYGVQARMRTTATVTLTADTSEYSMDSDVLDVFGDGMYIAASASDPADSETVITQYDQEWWQRMSAKSASAPPIGYYVDRSATTLVVVYWPIPDEAGSVRHMVQRHLADMDDTTATIDLQTYWTQWFLYELAGQLAEAKSIPGSKVQRLQGTAREKLVRARSFAQQHNDSYIYLDHSGGYT